MTVTVTVKASSILLLFLLTQILVSVSLTVNRVNRRGDCICDTQRDIVSVDVLDKVMYSASQVDKATLFCFLDNQVIDSSFRQ